MMVNRGNLDKEISSDFSRFWMDLGLTPAASKGDNADRIASDLATLCRIWPLIIVLKLAAFGLISPLAAQDFWIASPVAMGVLGASVMIDLAFYAFAVLADRQKIRPHLQLRTLLFAAAASSSLFAAALVSLVGRSDEPALASYAIVAHSFIALIVMIIASRKLLVGLSFSLGLVVVLYHGLPFTAFLVALPAYLAAILFTTFVHVRKDHADNLALDQKRTDEERALLLLSAYEQAALGWFWETDRNGRIVYLSDSIRRYATNRFGDLIGTQLTDLIMPVDKNSGVPSGERTLGFHLSSRSAFKEIAVQSIIFEEEKWWSLSGDPIFNQFDQFQGFRGSGADLTEMRRSQEEVKRLAEFDSLTGLANRFQMLGILEKAIIGPNGEVRPCALFLLDLDRFKTVNDTLGHPAGDALLKQVAQRLEETIGSNGHAGRIGGDEFEVVLPGIHDHRVLAALANATITALSRPYEIEGTQVVIGASIGIALSPDHGSTTQALIRNADLALYAAKDAGRGVHRFYDKSMHEDADERRNIEQDLRQALALNQLHLVYQPQVSTTTEQVSGFEALLRWNHPEHGPISPGVFIPIAEEAGLIQQIGEWVLRTACFELAKWPEHMKVAVNVSSIQFANPSFPAIVTNALSSAQVSPTRLELEITESVFINEGENTNEAFSSLKAIGVRLSLDDFGTGYSSLGYLKNAPFDKIKIDQGFVRGASIPGNRNAAIIKSIVSLAEALDMETIAEGAETHDELDLIRSLGCSHVQGYIYSKPLLPDEAMAMLAKEDRALVPKGFKSSRPPRRKMLRMVRVIHENHTYEAQIRNISARGALVIGLWNVPPDTEFIVEFSPRYRCKARSRWCQDDRMGLQFYQDIDFELLGGKSAASFSNSLGATKAA